MKFQATESQIQQIAANAVNASKPMGLSFLHFQPGDAAAPSDIQVSDRGVYLDYVQGRMVKLNITRRGDEWEISDSISADYQSWICKYPTTTALVESVLGPVTA